MRKVLIILLLRGNQMSKLAQQKSYNCIFKLINGIQKIKNAEIINRYLFIKGGAYNAAIARMVLAVALWYTIQLVGTANLWDLYCVSLKAWGWTPKGLVKIFNYFTGEIPSQDFVVGVYQLSKISIIMMFLGVFSRVSTIVAALSSTLFVSIMCSFGPFWSHGFNVELLAVLAFMFGRSGDVLSVDALINKYIWRRKELVGRFDGRYWWPVLSAELATHMFMFAAFYQKMKNGDGFWWALSDNLRNSLAVAWGLTRFDPPAIAEWLMQEPLVYKTAGVFQLCAQFSTIFCIFLIRHPVIRAIVGSLFFFLEIMGLTHLFRFWHPQWVPLCLLSIDWEWFGRKILGAQARLKQAFPSLKRLEQRLSISEGWVPVRTIPRFYKGVVYSFMAVFFGYYIANFVFSLGEKHLNYPFSSMAFYSENRAMRPFDKHTYYPIYRGWVEVRTKEDAPGQYVKFTDFPSDVLDTILGASGQEQEMRDIHASARMRMKLRACRVDSLPWDAPRTTEIVEIRTYRQIMAVPPYPRPPLPMVPLHSGLLSVEDERGFRGLAPRLEWDEKAQEYYIELNPYGFKNPSFRVLTHRNVRETPAEVEPTELAGQWQGKRFYIKSTKNIDASYLYTLIEVTDPVLGVKEIYAGPENFQGYR